MYLVILTNLAIKKIFNLLKYISVVSKYDLKHSVLKMFDFKGRLKVNHCYSIEILVYTVK